MSKRESSIWNLPRSSIRRISKIIWRWLPHIPRRAAIGTRGANAGCPSSCPVRQVPLRSVKPTVKPTAAGVLCLAGAAFTALFAAPAAPQCASCHRDQARDQPATDMAWALMPPESNKVLTDHPELTLRRGGYAYEIETRDGRSTYTVTDGKDKLSVPIRWSFGARSQTWVFENRGHFYESLVSYF